MFLVFNNPLGRGNRLRIVHPEIFKLLDYCLLVRHVDHNMPLGDFSFTLKKIKIHLPAGHILLKTHSLAFG